MVLVSSTAKNSTVSIWNCFHLVRIWVCPYHGRQSFVFNVSQISGCICHSKNWKNSRCVSRYVLEQFWVNNSLLGLVCPRPGLRLWFRERRWVACILGALPRFSCFVAFHFPNIACVDWHRRVRIGDLEENDALQPPNNYSPCLIQHGSLSVASLFPPCKTRSARGRYIFHSRDQSFPLVYTF